MVKNELFSFILLATLLISCIFTTSCRAQAQTNNPDNNSNNSVNNETVSQPTINVKIFLGKKYFYLGCDGYNKNEYYTFYEDGTATYTHVMKEGNKTIFHQILNFVWFYDGENTYYVCEDCTTKIPNYAKFISKN